MRKQQFILHSFGYIRIFLNGREFVSVFPHTNFGNCSSFAYDFQRHKQEMTQVKLVLQNKVLFV